MQLTEKVIELQADLARARSEHFRLVWVTGGTASERSALLRALSYAENGVYIEVGKKLSTAMIDVPTPLRTASVEDCFSACLGNVPTTVFCLDRLDVLFEPSLRINPIALIQGTSRNIPIVASWPGSVTGSHLIFGSPDHPAYMEIPKQDLEAIVYSL